jgi:hypothetical protein
MSARPSSFTRISSVVSVSITIDRGLYQRFIEIDGHGLISIDDALQPVGLRGAGFIARQAGLSFSTVRTVFDRVPIGFRGVVRAGAIIAETAAPLARLRDRAVG